MGAELDRVITSLQRCLDRESDRNLHRGMHFLLGEIRTSAIG